MSENLNNDNTNPNEQSDAIDPQEAPSTKAPEPTQEPNKVVGSIDENTSDNTEASPEAQEVEHDLDELRRRSIERDEYYNLLVRTKADFANYQKRIAEDRKRWSQMSKREVISLFLTTADQAMLAADNAPKDESIESLRSAIDLLGKEVDKFMTTTGVERIPTVGESFNPEMHEAVSLMPNPDAKDNSILAETRPGFQMDGVVLRAAQVIVVKNPAPEGSGSSATASTGSSPSDQASSGSSATASLNDESSRADEPKEVAEEKKSTEDSNIAPNEDKVE